MQGKNRNRRGKISEGHEIEIKTVREERRGLQKKRKKMMRNREEIFNARKE